MIIELIAGYFMVGIMIGFLMGVFEAWNPKIFMICLIIFCILVVLSTLYTGVEKSFGTIKWYCIVAEIGGLFLGLKSGTIAYDDCFKKFQTSK